MLKPSMNFILVLFFSQLACSQPYEYQGKAISGTIIDAESKRPLEGVVVAALWDKRGGLHTDTIGYIHIDEAVTDHAGRYHLPAWGPVKVSDGYMASYAPQLLIFKQGYRYLRINQGFLPPAKERKIWRSKWHGQTVELEPFKEDAYEYKYHLGSLESRIKLIREGKDCEWTKARRLLVEIYNSEIEIRDNTNKIHRYGDKSAVNINFIHSLGDVRNQEKCGDSGEAFEGLL